MLCGLLLCLQNMKNSRTNEGFILGKSLHQGIKKLPSLLTPDNSNPNGQVGLRLRGGDSSPPLDRFHRYRIEAAPKTNKFKGEVELKEKFYPFILYPVAHSLQWGAGGGLPEDQPPHLAEWRLGGRSLAYSVEAVLPGGPAVTSLWR